jgi:hypothetical protein
MTGFIVSVFPFRNRVSSTKAFEGLELGEGKPSRPVLRGPGGRKVAWLLGSDTEECRGRASIAAAKQFCQNIRHGASCAGPRQRQAFRDLSIRMVAGYREVAGIKEFLGCGGLQPSELFSAVF